MDMGWLINGQETDTFTVSSGAVVGHLLNASNAGYLKLDWPNMRVIAHDQGYQGRVYETHWSGPGDRAEVERLPGNEPILVDNQPFSLNGGESYQPKETLFSLVPLGDAPPAPAPLWEELEPDDQSAYLSKSSNFTYVFHGDNRTNTWMLNGQIYPDVTPFEAQNDTTVVIEVRNVSATNHPFHMRHAFQVIARNGEPVDSRNLHDTIDVAISETLRLKVDLTNPGDWMVHCHILPHAYAGMMTFMMILNDQS